MVRILLFLVYFLVFAPASLLSRVFRDPLHRRVNRRAGSYWITTQAAPGQPVAGQFTSPAAAGGNQRASRVTPPGLHVPTAPAGPGENPGTAADPALPSAGPITTGCGW